MGLGEAILGLKHSDAGLLVTCLDSLDIDEFSVRYTGGIDEMNTALLRANMVTQDKVHARLGRSK